MMHKQDTSTIYDYAIAYQKRGWNPIPVHSISTETDQCTCNRADCPSPAKHPIEAHWPQTRLTLPDVYTVFVERYPHANVGMITGQAVGYFALDIDPKNGGDETLRKLIEENGPLGDTYTQKTGSGGEHYLFTHPDFHVKGDTTGKIFGPGIDIRAHNNMIVMAGSRTDKGLYVAKNDVRPVGAPEWVLERMRSPAVTGEGDTTVVEGLPEYSRLDPYEQERVQKYAIAAIEGECRNYSQAPPGHGNAALYKASCNIIEIAQSPWNTISLQTARDLLDKARLRRLGIHQYGGGQTESELKTTWDSAKSTVAGQGRPYPGDPYKHLEFNHPFDGPPKIVTEGDADLEFVFDEDEITPNFEQIEEELASIDDAEERKNKLKEIIPHLLDLNAIDTYNWRELCKKNGINKGDFNEILKEAKKERKLAEKAKRRKNTTGTALAGPIDGRPLLEVSNEALAAEWLRTSIGTSALSGLFLRDGLIVRTAAIGEEGYIPPANEEDENGPAQVRRVDKSALSSLIDRTFTCYRVRETNEGEKIPSYTLFPKEASRIAVDIPDMLPNLRKLRGVVHVPTIRKDGSLLKEPGYDPATRLLYLPEPGLVVPPVPEQPTDDQLRTAVAFLEYMVADFKFLTEHDKANYFGILLTPLLRDLIPPPYKLGAIGAPMQGSGKTLLAMVARIIHGGVFRSEMPEDDAELRKAITTILDVSTGPIVHFDNVSGTLRSSALAGLLTSATWSDRRLGGNDMMTAPNDRLWLITGNNLRLGGDLVRRALWVTIDPGIPDPHLRTEFVIGDLEGWVRENRGKLIHALLTLIRAWIAAGRPTQARGSDSFGKWIEAVGGILGHAGVSGQFDAKEAARQTVGEDDEEWREFIEAVERVFGTETWTIRKLLGRVEIDNRSLHNDDPPFMSQSVPVEVLPGKLAKEVHMSKDPLSVNQSLGRWLKNHDGRWAGRLVIRSAGKDRTNKSLWRIDRAL